jgi:hypothetical protein
MTKPMSTAIPSLSRRQKTGGPNHHLWNNHGTWWFHGTIHKPDGTAERVRVNLATRDEAQARRKRDNIISRFSTC